MPIPQVKPSRTKRSLNPPQCIAILAQIDDELGTDWIVGWPVLPGLQPCLIVKTTLKRLRADIQDAPKIQDALVILPSDAPTKLKFPEPEFAAYLALAGKEYQREMNRARGGNDPQAAMISALSYTQPPYCRGGSTARTTTWMPFVRLRGRMMANKKWKEHRAIIREWTNWEKGGCTREQTLKEHYLNTRRILPPKGPARTKAWANFREKYRWLGL